MKTFAIRTVILVAALLSAMLMAASVAMADSAGEENFDPHGTTFNYFFEDGDMDFHFGNLVLGSSVNGGVEVGEAFYAASRVEDGNASDWHREWGALAKRVEARGMACLKNEHTVSARTQLLRAAYYYRLSLLAMQPDNPELSRRGNKCRELMKKAGAMFSPPLEYFEIPFENMVLPGFFRKVDNNGKPAKTLLMIGGGETFIEDLFFYIEPQAHARGYNFMTVDLPGQGLLPLEGHTFRTDNYLPMKKVVDYALKRKDVDPARFAAYGISGGGLFVPQAAMYDPRIRAIAMCSGVVDARALFKTMPAASATPEQMAEWTPFHAGIVASICWRYGVDKPSELVEANRGNTFDPRRIEVPALLLVGEGEYRSEEVQRQQKIAMEGFSDPHSALVLTPADEGASNHCIMENRSIVGQVLFDWLDDIFK